MENKELYKINLKGKIEQFSILEDGISFTVGEKNIELKTYHESDCCERVYADFSDMKYQKDSLESYECKGLIIKAIEKMGFLICFIPYYGIQNKIFVPCYNSQNGYYSSDLELQIKINEISTKIDISNFVEDDID